MKKSELREIIREELLAEDVGKTFDDDRERVTVALGEISKVQNSSHSYSKRVFLSTKNVVKAIRGLMKELDSFKKRQLK